MTMRSLAELADPESRKKYIKEAYEAYEAELSASEHCVGDGVNNGIYGADSDGTPNMDEWFNAASWK